jgi:hypothetical protein
VADHTATLERDMGGQVHAGSPQLGDQSRLTLGLEGGMVDGMYRVDVVILLGAN